MHKSQKKTPGVVYTPKYIVEYLVNKTVGQIINGKTPEEIEKLKFIDPSCGTGNFLLGIFGYIERYILDFYEKNKIPKSEFTWMPDNNNNMHLSDYRKNMIIQNNIYGIDTDKNAVNTCREYFCNSANIIHGNALSMSQEFSGTFDAVIGNPPYIGEKGNKHYFDKVKETPLKQYYQGKMDYFYFFFHLALDIAKENALISYITTNYFLTANGAYKLRSDIKKRSTIYEIVDLNDIRIFSDAVGQNNIIMHLTKKQQETYNTKITHISRSTELGKKLPSQLIPKESLFDGKENYIRITACSKAHNSYLKKLEKECCLLGDICNVNTGIMGGCDNITIRNIKYCSKYIIKKNRIDIGDGVFVLDKNNIKDKKFISKVVETDYLKNFYKNSDINKYFSSLDSGKYILFSSKHNDAFKHPKIKSHLLKYKDILIRLREINGEKTDLFPYLRRGTSNTSIFSGPKIIAPQRSYVNCFAYNEEEWYASADVYYITPKNNDFDLKYILALLNSRVYYAWLYHKGKRKGRMLELYQTPLSKIPVKKLSAEKQKPFIEQINNILNCDPLDQKRITFLQNNVDSLVCDLYKLSKTETKNMTSQLF